MFATRHAWVAGAALGALALVAGSVSDVRCLEPGAERSPFSWVAALAILLAAVCAALLARDGRSGPRLLLAAALVFVALDEAFGLHERFADDLDARRLSLGWPTAAAVAEAVALIAAGLLLALEARRKRETPLVVAGVLLLAVAFAARLGGAVLIEVLQFPTGGARRAGEAAAHAAALSGWILVAAGLLARVREPGKDSLHPIRPGSDR